MATGIRTVIFPVKDVAAATAVYRALTGEAPYVEQPYYVGFRVDDQEIGLDPNGHAQGLTAPIGYFHVADIRQRLGELLAAGAEEHQPVRDVGGGRLIASVRDADGNVVGLLQES
jgi:predicted enzyme related to lactoylglutathione lyase